MKTQIIALAGIMTFFGVANLAEAQTPPWASTPAQCIDHYRRTLVFLRNNMAQANVNSKLMNSLGEEDTYQAPDKNCALPLSESNPGLEQRTAQAQTAFVNYCAIRTTLCTIRLVKSGQDCMAAVAQCMKSDPIPRAAP